jgi:hypothetical protein
METTCLISDHHLPFKREIVKGEINNNGQLVQKPPSSIRCQLLNVYFTTRTIFKEFLKCQV